MIGEIFLSLFLVWLTWYVLTTYMLRKNMPPGPFPFPIVGNIPHMLSDPSDPFIVVAKKYGDIFTVTVPSGNLVVLGSAKLSRDAMLGTNDDLTGASPESMYPWTEILDNDVVAADYSPAYRFRRRVFKSAMHVFGAGIEQASELARHAVDIAIDEIELKNGKPFSPKVLLESSILVQLWEWVTSKRMSLDDPAVKCLSELNQILVKQDLLLPSLYQMFPFLSYLPTQFNRDIKRAVHIKNSIFAPEYLEHKKTYTPEVIRDLTDSFIRSYEKEIAKERAKDIGSIDDVIGLMTDVIVAGSDTTSTSLDWLFLYLILNPNVQEKIHKELDVVVGSDRVPRWKDVQNMPYLQATLCEMQRASSSVPAFAANAIRDTSINGYHIPKGTLVAINLLSVHNDEREWTEPEKFKPERFLDCDGNFVSLNTFSGFQPFGIGRRECPGQSLAKIMMFTFASVLLHRYKIELPEGAEIPSTDFSTYATVVRPKEYQVVAIRRK